MLKYLRGGGQNSHFFGSIVSKKPLTTNQTTKFDIIDGQQRLTTITLLFLAIRNLIQQDEVKTEFDELDKKIWEKFLTNKPIDSKERKPKLSLVESDQKAFSRLLYSSPKDYIQDSNLTINYQFFCDEIKNDDISVDNLYKAIDGLRIINVVLDHSDDAQLIFESLNATGLALSEGDKIRNYVLMDLKEEEQDRYYKNYWVKIESCADEKDDKNNVSAFIRDYLSIKQKKIPNEKNVYKEFKSYAESKKSPENQTSPESIEALLQDLLRYGEFFKKLWTYKSELPKGSKVAGELDACLERLAWLKAGSNVARPFFMEVFSHHNKCELSEDDVLKIFLIIESYLFRRNICDVPTNGLNKIFLSLDKSIIQYDGTKDDYVGKLIHTLQYKTSNNFPEDDKFKSALATKNTYDKNSKYYLLERFENYGTKETKPIYRDLDEKKYQIEHIMPQKLSSQWREDLGEGADKIHNEWCNRLANLTLTAYNQNMSNKTFKEKCGMERGYQGSGLRMNQTIAKNEKWGLAELEERSEALSEQAKKIWLYPTTDFVPKTKELLTYTLDNEDYDFTHKKLIKYSYLDEEYGVTDWARMFKNMVKLLHQQDRSVLLGFVSNPSDELPTSCISKDASKLRSPSKIDDGVYVETNSSTETKLAMLRKIFVLFKAEPSELVFYLK
ncbi:DUF262 domain-containing protein [Helicobacter sp. 12S02634-8]|uniref:DUF262 domain-containing protein n=1 Tax=Helicobacter sp. 12S02634-8 TaxID=1476199 RepID=UPI000BA560B2|nr:DUF262 domain-containing protein [Helicobacter sp. 12S02634-8]